MNHGNDNKLKNLFEIAFDKFVLKKDEEAVSLLDNYIELDTTNAEAYSMRGTCLNNLGYHLDAIDDYKKSLELKEDYNIDGLCGCAYMIIHDYKNAYFFLDKAVRNGWDTYSSALFSVKLILENDVMNSYIKSNINQDKLKRRNKTEQNINFDSSQEDVLNVLKNELPNLKQIVDLNPENTELRNLYENSKKRIELVELFEIYLSIENPSKDNMKIDLLKLNYESDEADTIVNMFFNNKT